jgi:hypothetical protein
MTASRQAIRMGAAVPSLERVAKALALAVVVGIGINHIYWAIVQWPLGDMAIYLGAADRIRGGQALYDYATPSYATYWYAPWFAYACVPFTYLPRIVTAVLWSAILVAATGAVAWQLARLGSFAAVVLSALIAAPLFAVSGGGNIQALLVLSLMLGLDRRSGPIWVAIAASLKFTPILFVLVYLRRREWARAVLAIALTALLVAPSFLLGFDPIKAASSGSEAPSLFGISPALYSASVVVVLGVGLIVDQRFARLAAATGAVLALPRLFIYDVTLVAVGAPSAVGGAGAANRPGAPPPSRAPSPTKGCP